jgi:hypothetical protein
MLKNNKDIEKDGNCFLLKENHEEKQNSLIFNIFHSEALLLILQVMCAIFLGLML